LPQCAGQPDTILYRGSSETQALFSVVPEIREAEQVPCLQVVQLSYQTAQSPLEFIFHREQGPQLAVQRSVVATPRVKRKLLKAGQRSGSQRRFHAGLSTVFQP